MKTNYKNLTAFEAAAVVMVVLGLSLIGFQAFLAMPEETKSDITGAFQLLEMHDVWETQLAVNDVVFGGMEKFYEEFYIALVQVAKPVGEQVKDTALAYTQALQSAASYSDSIAQNYQSNYVQSGVEADMGGKVLGAYLLKLAE